MAGRPRGATLLGAGAAAALACSACTVSGGATAGPTPPAGVVTPATPSLPTTATAAPTASPSSASPTWTPWLAPTASGTPGVPSGATPTPSAASTTTATLGAAVPSAAPAGHVLQVPAGTQRAITIADASAAGSWVQGGYRPVGSGPTIEALASQIGCNGTSGTLEFRFAQTSGTLVLGIAQAIDSASATEKLNWTATADGKLAQSASLGFRDAAELTVPLAGVSVVDVTASVPGPCTAGATGLVVKAVVNG